MGGDGIELEVEVFEGMLAIGRGEHSRTVNFKRNERDRRSGKRISVSRFVQRFFFGRLDLRFALAARVMIPLLSPFLSFSESFSISLLLFLSASSEPD